MLANLFPLLRDASAVTAIIGTNPVRFYRHGSAPQGVIGPYVTHQVVDQPPENDLSGLPPADVARVQVSCWSENLGTGSKGIETLARAVRDAIEPKHYILDVRDMGQDIDTKRYRIDLDVQVWVHRESSSS